MAATAANGSLKRINVHHSMGAPTAKGGKKVKAVSDGKKKQAPIEGSNDSDGIIKDARFAKLHTDPRFRKFPKDKGRVVVDERFKGAILLRNASVLVAVSRFAVFSTQATLCCRHVRGPRIPGRWEQGRQAWPCKSQRQGKVKG